MSTFASKEEAAAVKFEHESLSLQAQQLASSLALRRADLALMRGEAATVALSLESTKQRLDIALRTESEIRLEAPPSPKLPSIERADFIADAGLVRALNGQLDVTRASVIEADKKRLSLIQQISQLKHSVVAMTSTSNQGVIEIEKKKENDDKRRAEEASEGRTQSQSQSQTEAGWLERRRSSRLSVERSVLQVLEDGVSSRSSFRLEHAKLWRDSTMPNVILADIDGKAYSLGVVTERIFEGVTSFTRNDTDTDTSQTQLQQQQQQLNIKLLQGEGESKGINDDNVRDCVIERFGTLCSKSSMQDGRIARIVAPRVALEKVRKLASDARRRSSTGACSSSINTEIKEKQDNKLVTDGMTDVKLTPPAIVKTDEGITSKENDIIYPSLKGNDKSCILNGAEFGDLMNDGVPIRFHESSLNLVYSTDLHGMSLRTLFSKTKNTSPTIIAIRDTENRVFGCYATQAWRASATRYYGTGESFVFGSYTKLRSGGDGKSKRRAMKVYKWSRSNSLFQFTSSSFLAMGGGTGSHFALWVDEDLFMGTTSTCSTFTNPPLTNCDKYGDNDDGGGVDENVLDTGECTEFKILGLEVWGFATGRL